MIVIQLTPSKCHRDGTSRFSHDDVSKISNFDSQRLIHTVQVLPDTVLYGRPIVLFNVGEICSLAKRQMTAEIAPSRRLLITAKKHFNLIGMVSQLLPQRACELRRRLGIPDRLSNRTQVSVHLIHCFYQGIADESTALLVEQKTISPNFRS